MRILHIIQELGIGGAERTVACLIAGSQRVGHETAVLAANGPFAAHIPAPIFPLPMIRRRISRMPAAARAVGTCLDRWSPDLIHCHNPSMAIALKLAMMTRRRVRALVTVQGMPARDYGRIGRILGWTGLPLVACGPGVAHLLCRQGLQARTITNGVSAAPQPLPRSDLDREWPALRGHRVVLALGRLVAQKHYALAIRALAHIPGAALLIVGDGPERPLLEREAERVGVGERVCFAGFRSNSRAIIGAADLLVIPSHWEGLPLVALEAWAAGCPIVAVRAPWQRAFFNEGWDCLLAEPDNANDLAAAVRRVLDDPELSKRLAANGQRASTLFTEDRFVDAYLRLYEELLTS